MLVRRAALQQPFPTSCACCQTKKESLLLLSTALPCGCSIPHLGSGGGEQPRSCPLCSDGGILG